MEVKKQTNHSERHAQISTFCSCSTSFFGQFNSCVLGVDWTTQKKNQPIEDFGSGNLTRQNVSILCKSTNQPNFAGSNGFLLYVLILHFGCAKALPLFKIKRVQIVQHVDFRAILQLLCVWAPPEQRKRVLLKSKHIANLPHPNCARVCVCFVSKQSRAVRVKGESGWIEHGIRRCDHVLDTFYAHVLKKHCTFAGRLVCLIHHNLIYF